MKKLIFIFGLWSIFFSACAQRLITSDDEVYYRLTSDFYSSWIYFRLRTTPDLPFKITRDNWNAFDLLLPKDFVEKDYIPVFKIYRWYPDFQERNAANGCVTVFDPNFYVIEKEDGLTGVKWDFFTFEKMTPLDTMQVNVYDSLFLYDNRFLAHHGVDDEISFCSGNVFWDYPRNPKDLNWLTGGVARIGYIRGVQFSVDMVKAIEGARLEEIRSLRAEWPEYVYAEAVRSAFCLGRLLIGAPKGKETELIEYIFYSNDPAKTGDPDLSHIYEMRYVLPSRIKSIRERRMEQRRLSPEECEHFENTPLYRYWDYWKLLLPPTEPDEGEEVEEWDFKKDTYKHYRKDR